MLKHRKSVYFQLHMRLQLMWIESVLGHSFLACNLLWPCSLIETSDTELSGIHWSRKVSYLKMERHDVARAYISKYYIFESNLGIAVYICVYNIVPGEIRNTHKKKQIKDILSKIGLRRIFFLTSRRLRCHPRFPRSLTREEWRPVINWSV